MAAGADADLGGGYRSARVDGAGRAGRAAVLAAPPCWPRRRAGRAAVLAATPCWPRRRAGRDAVLAATPCWPRRRAGRAGCARTRRPRSPPACPSVVGGHLGRVLHPLSAARLPADLWEQVCAAGVARARRDCGGHASALAPSPA
ncbi:hypothetical protein [Actinoplanes sp. NPDC049599]|uniref:hypothetical protein n=1 Tax=Actinoplanes sp. NPDC049599 TaxID=3363903 RepID=UPI0037919082